MINVNGKYYFDIKLHFKPKGHESWPEATVAIVDLFCHDDLEVELAPCDPSDVFEMTLVKVEGDLAESILGYLGAHPSYSDIDELADQLDEIQAKGRAKDFLALVEAESFYDAIEYGCSGRYTFYPGIKTAEELSRFYMESEDLNDIPQKFIEYFDHKRYGQYIRDCDAGAFTSYGYVATY